MPDFDADSFKRNMIMLLNGKNGIKAALIAKGISVDNVPLSGYANLIRTFKNDENQGGGGGGGGGGGTEAVITPPILGIPKVTPITGSPSGVYLTDISNTDPWPFEFTSEIVDEGITIEAGVALGDRWTFNGRTLKLYINNCPSDEFVNVYFGNSDAYATLVSTSADEYEVLNTMGGITTIQIKQAFVGSTGTIELTIRLNDWWNGAYIDFGSKVLSAEDYNDKGTWGETPPEEEEPVQIGTGWRCVNQTMNFGKILSIDACVSATALHREAFVRENFAPGFVSTETTFSLGAGLNGTYEWDGTTLPIEITVYMRSNIPETISDQAATYQFTTVPIYAGDQTFDGNM